MDDLRRPWHPRPDPGQDVARIREFVAAGRARTAFAVFIDEGRHFRQGPFVAAIDCFPNLKGREDSALISQAARAVASFGMWTERHWALIDQQEQYAQDVAAAAAKAVTNRAFSASIQRLREQRPSGS